MSLNRSSNTFSHAGVKRKNHYTCVGHSKSLQSIKLAANYQNNLLHLVQVVAPAHLEMQNSQLLLILAHEPYQ